MSKSVRVASVATVTLSMLAFVSASAASLAAIRAVDDSPPVPVLLATTAPAAAAPDSTPKSDSAAAPVVASATGADLTPQASADLAPRSLATLVAAQDSAAAPLDEEGRCLATAVFYEARSESLAGQLAVARVVINRTKSGRFPTSLCGVVTQPGQFSFVRGGRLPLVDSQSAQWRNATAIARIALDDMWDSHAEGALFFHAARVSPGWSRQRLAQVGNHVFYR